VESLEVSRIEVTSILFFEISIYIIGTYEEHIPCILNRPLLSIVFVPGPRLR
jgi:hypothetical protein